MSPEALQNILEGYPRQRESLIPILQQVQEQFGYLPKEAIVHIGRHLELPASKIYGVATFYNQFRFRAPGRFHIQVCRGTACHVIGSQAVQDALEQHLGIKTGDSTRDGLFSLEVVACLGACGLAPVISVNGVFYAGVTPDRVRAILNTYRRKAAQNESEQ